MPPMDKAVILLGRTMASSHLCSSVTRIGALLTLIIPLASTVEAFTIISPAAGAVLKSGQGVTARVNMGTDVGMQRVHYYWYRLGEEPLPRHLAQPALTATSSSDPSYGGTLQVPLDAMGQYRLLAVGEVAVGRLAGREEFDEAVLQIEPPAELTGIEFEVEKPWHLDTLGKIHEVAVIGLFADGVSRRLGGVSSGSSYRTSHEQVIRVLPDGLIQVMGNGQATLTVTNQGKEGSVRVVVKSDSEPNQSPTARTIPDMTVKSGSTVVLDALGSSDPDGDPLRYEWMQVRGNKVSLLDPNTPHATFVAPKVSVKRLLRFKLRVTDMRGPDTVKGADSLPAFVNVWVEP
jgi:hypothetical protein